jgi:hypothetical protein
VVREERQKGKGKERSEKGGGDSVRISTCAGSRGGGACFVENLSTCRRRSEASDAGPSVTTVLEQCVLVPYARTFPVSCKLPPFELCNYKALRADIEAQSETAF